MSTKTARSEIDLAAKAVKLALGAGASQADAWLKQSREGSFTMREGDLEQAREDRSTTLALRVFVGQRTATASSADLSLAALHGLAAQAVELARLSDSNPRAGLPDAPAMTGEVGASLDLYDSELVEQTPETLIALALRAEAAGLSFDPRITKSEGAIVSRRQATTALANSRGFAAAYRETACSLSTSVIAVDRGDPRGQMRGGNWSTSDRYFARLEEPEQIGRLAAARALRQLGARTVPTQEAPVIWSPQAGAILIEVMVNVSEAVSGAALNQGSTFLIGQEGQPIGSPLFTLIDDPTLPGQLGTRPFDDEGVVPQRTPSSRPASSAASSSTVSRPAGPDAPAPATPSAAGSNRAISLCRPARRRPTRSSRTLRAGST